MLVFLTLDELRDYISFPSAHILLLIWWGTAALRFQPTKRPQVAQKPKPKPVSAISNITPQKVPPASDVAAPPVANTTPSSFAARQPPKSTLADWTADDEDVNGFYAGERRQRGGKRRKKKNNRESEAIPQNWDDNYDPSRPTNYEEYKNSDEKIQEIRDWKDRLYAHRMTNRRGSSESDGEDDYRPAMSSMRGIHTIEELITNKTQINSHHRQWTSVHQVHMIIRARLLQYHQLPFPMMQLVKMHSLADCE